MSCQSNRPTHEDYIIHRGQIEFDQFDRLMAKAWAYLDVITLGGVNMALPSSSLERVHQAAFAVLEEYRLQESGGEVSSASNDGYSETYVTSKKTPEQRLYSAASLYLAPTGLLYCGFGGGPC